MALAGRRRPHQSTTTATTMPHTTPTSYQTSAASCVCSEHGTHVPDRKKWSSEHVAHCARQDLDRFVASCARSGAGRAEMRMVRGVARFLCPNTQSDAGKEEEEEVLTGTCLHPHPAVGAAGGLEAGRVGPAARKGVGGTRKRLACTQEGADGTIALDD